MSTTLTIILAALVACWISFLVGFAAGAWWASRPAEEADPHQQPENWQ